MSGNYGPGDDGPWPPAGHEPQWDDSVWQQDQPSAWGGQEGAQPGQGQQQPYDGRGYGGQDYDQGQQYDRGQGYDQGQAYPGRGYGGQAGGQTYEQPGHDGRNYGQPDPRTRPGYPPQGPGTGPQQYPRGTGGQQVQRGTGGLQAQRGTGGMQPVPPGYDPRGTGPRRPAGGDRDYPSGGYPQRGDAGYGAGGYEGREPQRDDSFLPGFGPRDDFEGGDQQYDARRDPRRGAARRARDGRVDGRAADIGRGPDGRAAEFAGPDQRVRGDRGRARDDDRDARGARAPRRGGARDDWDGNGGNGGPGGYGGDGPRRKRRSPIRRLAPWIALLVIVVPLAVGGLHIWDIYQAKVHPADYTGAGTTPTVTVQVVSGANAAQLAPTLLADGVIESTRAFQNAANTAEAATNARTLEPGYFELHSHMQASLAWAFLTNPKNMLQTVVTVPEGKRVSQVISILALKTKIPEKDFQQVIDHPAALGLPSYAKGVKGFPDSAVEGFLFPATYAITPHETATQILQAMVARFNVEANSIDIVAAAKSANLTPYQLIIEASMAQAEGGSVTDYPKIATVIKNRQEAGMTMGFDSVLFYGLNAYGINVDKQQEAVNSPYNDMTEHTGLPPTPIDNPGDAAIQGILHPTPGDWLYFLTVSGGKSEFSLTPLTGQ
jgi:UPF0755 protein